MSEKNKQEKNGNLQTRPPVVVVLGHVDHGKSSLIEKVKEIKILDKESGGITQHIGAYQVEHQGKKITFIDTPGHEAFSAMRSRGAQVADVAILVVAADEGVKPQTKEAIHCIKKAGISHIVAINKIDNPRADAEKVKGELAKNDILTESLGGEVPSVEISAKTGKGIQELLELILLVAEMEDLKADFTSLAEGVVVESFLDSKRGPIAVLLLKKGKLEAGEIIASSSTFGKIKSLEDFRGAPIQTAFPSMPCVVLGLQAVPGVGEEVRAFLVANDAQEHMRMKQKREEDREVIEVSPDKKIINLILKADVLGSLEAIEETIKGLPQEEICLRILKKEVGDITESDVKFAKSAQAKILGFRVKINPSAQKSIEKEKITILKFDVIYDLSQAIRSFMEKFLEPEIERVDFGKVKVLAVFLTEKNRQIIGGKVIMGEAKKGVKIELRKIVDKEEVVIGKGKLINLQKDKKNIDKVAKGQECGILYEGDIRVEEGNILQFYAEEKRKKEL